MPTILRLRFAVAAAAVLLSMGCGGGDSTAEKEVPPNKPAKKKVIAKPIEQKPATPPKSVEKPAQTPPERTLADLVAQVEAEKTEPIDPLRYKLPEVDEEKRAGRGIRKLESKYLTLYTDVPTAEAVDELPAVFDLAMPQWLAYFNIPAERAAKWHMVGVLAKEKERFFEVGLWPNDLPNFPNGYMRDRTFWLYEQPSDFYRRELLLHEGTHGFMWSFLGGMGPPWYGEGMAELLGTHAWHSGKLTLGAVPPSKEASPMWGRIKVVKEAWAAGKALPLGAILSYPPSAHHNNEAYAWSWAAALFFDHDPQYQKIFREAPATATDVSQNFSERLIGRMPQTRELIGEQWQCFVHELDYGYDVARASIVRKEAVPLPAAGAAVEVTADRAWQSSGFALTAGKTYRLLARGEFQIGTTGDQPWISQANGITLKYYQGHPLGMLLAAVSDEGKTAAITPLVKPVAVGSTGQFKCELDGVLYLRLNDAPASLHDNAGALSVTIEAE